MFGLIGAVLFGASAWAQQFSFSTVALSGQPAPGTAAGVIYSFPITEASLNGSGQAAFLAQIIGTGVGANNNTGIWLGAAGSVSLLAREGDAAPGTSAGINFSDFGVETPNLNAAGQSVFAATLIGGGVTVANNTGLWMGAPGSVALLARAGNAAPGTGAGINFSSFNYPAAINAAGQVAFFGSLTGGGVTNANDTGLWLGVPGSVALLARTGSQAPGMAAGVNYSGLGPAAINATGLSVFGANTSDGSNGLWTGAPGSVALLARSGGQAPGTPAGTTFLNFVDSSNVQTRPAINAAGQIAFAGNLTGTGVTGSNISGLWTGTPGNVALLARAGNQAPGTPAGITFANQFGTPTINASGQNAFFAGLTGAGVDGLNNQGIWRGTPGSMALVVRNGNMAPGAGAGTAFSTIVDFAFNDRGEVAFSIDLTGPLVTTANDSSLWFSDAAGNLTLIVREGSPFQVAPGDVRTVSFLFIAGNFRGGSGDEDGFPNGFNDQGQLAFLAGFTDGSSGIFIATVPEPSSLVVVALLVGGLGGTRWLARRQNGAAAQGPIVPARVC